MDTNTDEIRLLRQSKESYGSDFNKHLFEQYKLYVEMADRVSARRMLANSFFVSIHTALITAFTVLLKDDILPKSLVGVMPFFAVVLLCFIWWRIIYSYRQLNGGKFKIIHAFEQILPSAPYDAEWEILDKGTNNNSYFPLTHIENIVPICFGILYVLLSINLIMK